MCPDVYWLDLGVFTVTSRACQRQEQESLHDLEPRNEKIRPRNDPFILTKVFHELFVMYTFDNNKVLVV